MSEEFEGGGNNKMLLIVGLLGGLAVGGGVGFLVAGQQDAISGEDGGEVVKEEEEKKELPDLLVPVKIERIAVPIFSKKRNRNQFIGNYFIDVTLQTRSDADALKVRAQEPKLQHAFIDVVSNEGVMKKDVPEQIDLVLAKQAFMKRVVHIFGDELVYDLAITKAVRVSL